METEAGLPGSALGSSFLLSFERDDSFFSEAGVLLSPETWNAIWLLIVVSESAIVEESYPIASFPTPKDTPSARFNTTKDVNVMCLNQLITSSEEALPGNGKGGNPDPTVYRYCNHGMILLAH